MIQVAQAFANGNVKRVPDIVAGGSSGGQGSLVDVLLGNLISKGIVDGDSRSPRRQISQMFLSRREI